ncbi:hemerythrin domain-containing protein [Ramlibacter sp. USB13]|uniref:Hemerythrin domain-containing protein n=1 Tax=Ramlibacter cellulosilyticus TaxID=2764187 RepID=A0A923MNU7_9BURK|nr:hemerythrin domain-containing protein [Ramlibacter cellulosilyticus]MBC5783092.1 hemerythrin domain-containing protein [Ramlibacter cellulosilyticus]
MTQPIRLSSLVASPAAGFEEPFEMLEACHERVHRMLALLGRLREHVRTHGSDVQARQAARDVMRYFDMAAPQHHLDEELHVFPPLLAQGEERVAQVVRRLQQDHLEMESRWREAREVLVLVAEGSVDRLDTEGEASLDAFAGLYDAHIRSEEEIAYPAAQAAIDAPGRTAMGREMMKRRGVK